jgi:hypothetical protein
MGSFQPAGVKAQAELNAKVFPAVYGGELRWRRAVFK